MGHAPSKATKRAGAWEHARRAQWTGSWGSPPQGKRPPIVGLQPHPYRSPLFDTSIATHTLNRWGNKVHQQLQLYDNSSPEVYRMRLRF